MVALLMATLLAAEAPVTSAVLYSGQARLTRTAELTVSGHAAVELPLLPPESDPDSVRVEVSGARLEIVEVARLGPLSFRADEARKLLASVERLEDDLAVAMAEDASLAAAAETGDQVPAVADEEAAAWAGVDPERWRQTLTFLRSWRERLDERRARVAARIESLRSERRKLADQAAEVRAGDAGRVRVVVHLVGQGRARVRASYLIAGPAWSPRYEVRLDPARDEVSVSLSGLATQRTGEDWTETALTFSTALPEASTAAPVLPRWLIGERERFIPETTARVEPGAPAAPAPPAAEDPELADLRKRLLLLGSVKETHDLEVVEKPPAPPPSVLRSSAAFEVQSAGSGADRSAEIAGYVYDQTGNPIQGVKLVASGPGGQDKTTYSNSEGAFRIRGLAPGSYDVRAMAPKLKTVIQREIRVGPDRPAEVNVIMEVVQAIEEVQVVEKAPVVSTTTAYVSDGFDSNFVSAPSTTSRSRQTISLRAPESTYRRPRLAPGLAVLAGGHALAFAALTPESLASGATEQPVPLASWRWPVSVRRQLFPAVQPEAYLVATLRLPADTPLPKGDANLFVDGQPAGRAHLDLTRPGQQFTLPLGIDRAVRCRRQVELETHERGLLSKEEINRYTVTIDIANPHRRGVALDVVDQLPRARDGSVAVKLVSSDPPAKVDDKGILTWYAGVAAGKTLRLRFVYTLARPYGNRLQQERP
jgi:hypothetical protein